MARSSPAHFRGSEDDPERALLRLEWPPGKFDVRSTTLGALGVLAVLYTLHFARAIFLPLTLAILLSFLLAPVVRALRRLGIREVAGAAVVMLGLAAAIAGGGFYLAPVAADWIDEAPTRLQRFRLQTQELKQPIQEARRARDAMEDIVDVDGREERPTQVEVQEGPSIVVVTLGFVGQTAFVLIIAYLLLASRNLFLRKIVKLLPTFEHKRRAVRLARETEDQISAFLLARTLVNIALGVVTALVMYALGLPDPILWGVAAAVLNYVPYVGSAILVVALGLAAAMTWEDPAAIVLPPLGFLVLTTIDAYLVTPLVMNRTCALNLVAVFVGLFFWGWLWGPTGALIAMPLMATLRIVGETYDRLRPLGELLGR